MKKEKTEIIKPKKEARETQSLFTPIIYLILGIILAFKSNDVIQLIFYVLGIIAIIGGLKGFIQYYKYQSAVQYKNINIGVSVTGIVVGILLILLAKVLEASIRYVLGFFLIFIGVSRLLTDCSFSQLKKWGTISNILLIVFGVFSIFVSNIILVVIGWILIANSLILFWEYLKK